MKWLKPEAFGRHWTTNTSLVLLTQQSWAWVLALSFTSWVTLGKLLNILAGVNSCPILREQIIIAATLMRMLWNCTWAPSSGLGLYVQSTQPRVVTCLYTSKSTTPILRKGNENSDHGARVNLKAIIFKMLCEDYYSSCVQHGAQLTLTQVLNLSTTLDFLSHESNLNPQTYNQTDSHFISPLWFDK
jgi:hypothetical protein